MAPTANGTAARENGGGDAGDGAGDGVDISAASCDALLVDARKITIKLVHINQHFICKLCQGYLFDAQAIKECLHTFCNGCILPYFMKSKTNNSCPTCNVHLGVRPWEQLMPDPAIQELTLKILPDYREKDKIQAEEFYARLGIKRKPVEEPQVERPVQIKNKRICGPSPSHMLRFELHAQKSVEIPLFLWLKPLKYTRMNTQALLKIMHLRKYIAKKLKNVRPEEIEVLCKGAPVGPEYSLEFIRRTIWMDENAKMILEFRRQLT